MNFNKNDVMTVAKTLTWLLHYINIDEGCLGLLILLISHVKDWIASLNTTV